MVVRLENEAYVKLKAYLLDLNGVESELRGLCTLHVQIDGSQTG